MKNTRSQGLGRSVDTWVDRGFRFATFDAQGGSRGHSGRSQLHQVFWFSPGLRLEDSNILKFERKFFVSKERFGLIFSGVAPACPTVRAPDKR
jgi:hypothetical protein